MSLHEESPAKTIASSAVLGALSEVPGLGAVVGAIQGAIQAAARARDEDFLAMVAARISSLEAWNEGIVNLDNPEFLASTHRLFRVAQETSDEEKRARLAGALAHAGPWSNLPRDDRERMERVVADLTSREVGLLKILADPGAWLYREDQDAYKRYDWRTSQSFVEFLDVHVAKGIQSEIEGVHSTNAALQERSLVGPWNRKPMSMRGLFRGKITQRGRDVVEYIRTIES